MYIGFNKDSVRFFIAPFLGACIMTFSGIYLWGNDYLQENIVKVIPTSILGILILFGLWVIVSTLLNNHTLKKLCTESITAKCIGIDNLRRKMGKRYRTSYAAIFNYCYNGKDYRVQQDYYTNIDIPKIDAKVEIFINPNNPEEIYRPSFRLGIMKYSFGAIFMICGVIALYLAVSYDVPDPTPISVHKFVVCISVQFDYEIC